VVLQAGRVTANVLRPAASGKNCVMESTNFLYTIEVLDRSASSSRFVVIGLATSSMAFAVETVRRAQEGGRQSNQPHLALLRCGRWCRRLRGPLAIYAELVNINVTGTHLVWRRQEGRCPISWSAAKPDRALVAEWAEFRRLEMSRQTWSKGPEPIF